VEKGKPDLFWYLMSFQFMKYEIMAFYGHLQNFGSSMMSKMYSWSNVSHIESVYALPYCHECSIMHAYKKSMYNVNLYSVQTFLCHYEAMQNLLKS